MDGSTGCEGVLRDLNLIGGRWVAARDGRTFEVSDPASGARVATIPDSGGSPGALIP